MTDICLTAALFGFLDIFVAGYLLWFLLELGQFVFLDLFLLILFLLNLVLLLFLEDFCEDRLKWLIST